MKRSMSTLLILLMGLMFSTSNIAFADEKTTDTTEASDKKADSGDKAKKKKGKDGEEPECE